MAICPANGAARSVSSSWRSIPSPPDDYPDATWPGDDSRILPFAHHGGTSKGAMRWLVVYPDYYLSIAVNINTRTEEYSDFNSVERKIALLFLRREPVVVGNRVHRRSSRVLIEEVRNIKGGVVA